MTNQQERSTPQSTPQKRIVFISHANPEDNDFARWLGAQLASAGYEVWSDVIKLFGGEVFWDDIEDAIRNHSAKFIVAVSRAANTKNGVLDEVAVAIGVERTQRLTNFVVPLRLDDLEFSEFRANLTRKNAIDFSVGWAPGLASLLKVLVRDTVPRGAVSSNDVAAWCETRFDESQKVKSEPETLVSNWLTINELPSRVSLFSVGVEMRKVAGVMAGASLPWFPYLRMVGTFASEADLRADLPDGTDVRLHYELPTDRFLAGKQPELPGMTAQVARNHVSSLLRQSWDRTLKARGLSPFKMASGALAWFFTKGQLEGDRAYFVDHAGKRRRRLVVGRSERRKVYWHLGFQAKAVMGLRKRFVLTPVILFSEDGLTPISEPGRMHRLRRGFCRSWWNQHWRDLMLTYVAWLADTNATITLDAGEGASIEVGAHPLEFTSPMSCSDPSVKTVVRAEAEADEDEESPPEAPIEPDEEFGGSDDDLTDGEGPDA